jgi:hypothetical protein
MYTKNIEKCYGVTRLKASEKPWQALDVGVMTFIPVPFCSETLISILSSGKRFFPAEVCLHKRLLHRK